MSFEAQLGVGLHPMDRRGNEPTVVPTDTASGPHQESRAAFAVKNRSAVAVFERAAADWTGQTFVVSAPLQIAPRQKGRKICTLFVPSNAAFGVQLAPKREFIDAGVGVPLVVGASVDIPSEAPIWVGPLVGETTGEVSLLTFFNPQIED